MRIAVVVLALLVTTWGRALGDAPDPIGEALIPPDVIMSHQNTLGITQAQRNAILSAVQQAQRRFAPLQAQLAAQIQELAGVLRQPHVSERRALTQLDREQMLEREIKRAQLQLMIRVKNELTPAQQTKAFSLKAGHA